MLGQHVKVANDSGPYLTTQDEVVSSSDIILRQGMTKDMLQFCFDSGDLLSGTAYNNIERGKR